MMEKYQNFTTKANFLEVSFHVVVVDHESVKFVYLLVNDLLVKQIFINNIKNLNFATRWISMWTRTNKYTNIGTLV